MNVPVLVTSALPEEISLFVRRLSDRRTLGCSSRFFVGKLPGSQKNVAVLHTGMGVTPALKSLEMALECIHPDCIIVSGTAGALRQEVSVGDLLIASNYGTPTLQQRLLTQLRKTGTEKAVIWHETLHTTDQVISRPEEKKEVARQTGAYAVDMESRALVCLAEKKGVPVAVLRVMSDGLEDRLPLPFDELTNEDGFMSLFQLVGYLILRPWKIPALLRFGATVSNACDILSQALVESVTGQDLSRDCGRG